MHQKALKQKYKNTTKNTPKLMKTTTVSKWSDAIKFHLSRSCDLSYLILRLVTVPVVATSLEMNQPHSSEVK